VFLVLKVNCRIHGGEGTWVPMAEAALGYSAVALVVYLCIITMV